LRIAVIGGGISGLATGYALSKSGFAVDLYEKQPWLGGLAARCEVGGISLDRYYHFVCGGDSRLVSLCAELDLPIHWAPTRTSFYYDGKLHPFGSARDLISFDALSWRDRYRLARMMLACYRDRNWQDLDAVSAEDWLIERLGERAYRVIWYPLLRVKFGERYREISAAWIWHRLHRVLTSRRHPLAPELLGYMHGGAGEVIARLAERLRAAGGDIHLSTPALRLRRAGDGSIEVETSAGVRRCDAAVLALPAPVAHGILGGPSADSGSSPAPAPGTRRSESRGAEANGAELEGIDYIGVVCLLLVLERPVTDSFWINVNDPRVVFNGFIEFTNLDRQRAGGRHVVYVPYYCHPSEPRFSQSDASVCEEYFAALQLIAPSLRAEQVVEWRVFRDPYAQPICTRNFADRVAPFTGAWPNLFITESTQLYPADRNLSGMIELADRVTKLIGGRPWQA